MKQIIQLFCFIFLISSSIHAEPIKAKSEADQWVLGKQWTKQIVEEYLQGKYDDFLQKLDADYKEILQDEIYEKYFTQPDKILQNPETCEILKQRSEDTFKKVSKLSEETQQQLGEIAKSHPDSLVSSIINEAICTDLTSDEKQAFQFLTELSYPPSEKAEEGLLATLQQISKESFNKHSLLYMRHHRLTGSIDKNQVHHEAVIIKLSAFQKMLEVSHHDQVINPKVFNGYLAYLKNTAHKHDWAYLESLGTGKRIPANEAEEKAATIMKSYIFNKKQLQHRMLENAWEQLGLDKDPQKLEQITGLKQSQSF